MKHFPKLLASIIGCELVGFLSVPFTSTAIPSWYASLTKPPFAPPNWLFAPVWTFLYLSMGVSLYFVWIQGWRKKKIKVAMRWFFLQLALNFLWSPLFFGLRSPVLALTEIVWLWLLIAMTMKHFYELSKPAFYLLIPYLLWVTFAAILNASIVALN